jgi:peptidoglycan/LPS O-acetylase OafA/YrhL
MAALSLGFLLLGSPILTHLFGGAYFATVGMTLRSFAVGSIIMWASSSEEGSIRGLLTSRLMVRIGLMSYSLYLWQQPFFDEDVHATWVGSLPVALAGTFALAELSYRAVELPMARLRARTPPGRAAPAASSRPSA